MLNQQVKEKLHDGVVIPAHPLALTKDRKLDEIRQRALTRYYIESGAGGVAVGVFIQLNSKFVILGSIYMKK